MTSKTHSYKEVQNRLNQAKLQRGFYQRGQTVRWLYEVIHLGGESPTYFIKYMTKGVALKHLRLLPEDQTQLHILSGAEFRAMSTKSSEILKWFEEATFIGETIPELVTE